MLASRALTSGSTLTSGGIVTALGYTPAPAATVILWHGSTQTPFQAATTATTDLWTALTDANAAAVSGDVLLVGPGTYYGGTANKFLQTNGTTIYGAGKYATVIKSNGTNVVFNPGTGCEIAYLTIAGFQTGDSDGGANQPFGATTDSTNQVFSGYFHDLLITGQVDGFYVKKSGCTGTLRDVDIVTEFDSIRNLTVGAGNAFDWYSCNLTQAGTNASNKRGAVISAGTYRFFNCSSFSDDTNDSGGAGGHLCLGFQADNSGVVEIYGGSSLCTAGSSNTDVNQSGSGTMTVIGAMKGSGTRGALVTGGTIQPNPANTPTLSSYAVGTAYTLTATPAAAAFGTTSPSITLTAGRWRVYSKINIQNNGATFAASRTVTGQLQDTTNTVSITNGSDNLITGVVTTVTSEAGDLYMEAEYTVSASAVIVPFVSVSVVPTAGSIQATAPGTWIKAEYLGPS